MRVPCMVVVYLLTAVASTAAQPAHVRLLDGIAAVAYEQGVHHSATFRAIVTALDTSDVIVHVVSGRDLPPQVAGTTRFVARQAGWRYVRIDISSALMPKARISVLGHELQHALEIAESGACSPGEVQALYQVHGIRAPTLPGGWETTAAGAVERRIWIELGRGATRAHTVEQ